MMQRSRSSSIITFSYYNKVVKSFVFVYRDEFCSNLNSIFCCCVFGFKPTNVVIRFLFELSGSSIRVDAEKGD